MLVALGASFGAGAMCRFKRGLAVLVACTVGAGCARLFPDDFSVSGETTQREEVSDLRAVIIRCFCPDRAITPVEGATQLELRISATHSSVGYHGEQDRPSTQEDFGFVATRADGVLVLESPEYRYIHHTLIFTRLRVLAPAAVDVRFEPLVADDLHRGPG